MKTLFFSLFLALFSLSVYGKSPAQKPVSKTKAKKATDQRPAKSSSKKPTSKDKEGMITGKIKKIFEDFIEILEKEKVHSSEYVKAVQFLENSLYNEASFESLKLLAEVYKQKKDIKNQINVLNVLSSNYPDKADSFYLLGEAYRDIYLDEDEKKAQKKSCQKARSSCLKKKSSKKKTCKSNYRRCLSRKKLQSIEYLKEALKLDQKNTLAYEVLLSLLTTKNPDIPENIYSREALLVITDMLKNLKKRKYYIPLCKAYYDNKFLKQARNSCKQSAKYNPKDPLSFLILALSQSDKSKIGEELLKVAKKFKRSFFVQYQTAIYFMKKDPRTATTYFQHAYKLMPDNLKLNEVMSDFLFENEAEEASYKHFFKVCQLTNGRSVVDFRRAKNELRRQRKVDLGIQFQEGIKKCFAEVKKERDSKKKR